MKRIIKPLILIVLAAAVVAGGALVRDRLGLGKADAAGVVTRQIMQVTQGNLASTITLTGDVEATQTESLAFTKMSGTGTLLTVDVKAGGAVKAGQVLATIDPTPYQTALDQAKTSLKTAQEKLDTLKTPATKLDLAKADVAVAKAKLQLQQAQDTLDDLLQPDLTKLRTNVANAERALAEARLNVTTLNADTATADKIDKLRDTEAKASAEYTRLVNETTSRSDAVYNDRVQIALNKLKAAEDARVTAELNRDSSLVKATMSVRKAEAALADAKDALSTAEAGGDVLAIANAKLAVQEADVAVTSAMDARDDLVAGADATTVAAAQADVDKKTQALANAEQALAGCKLTAPFDGTVIRVARTAGTLIGSSTTIMQIANMKTLQVMASVDETTIRRVKEGQDVTITFDAFSGQTFRGKVVSVPLQGALQNNVMIYDVPISLTGTENVSLLIGMTANVRVIVAQARNATVIPTIALKQTGGKYQVQVPTTDDPNGVTKTVEVTVGLSDGVNTQIVSGLNVGDKVVVEYTTGASTTSTQQQGQQFMMNPGMGGQIPQGGGFPQGGGNPPGR